MFDEEAQHSLHLLAMLLKPEKVMHCYDRSNGSADALLHRCNEDRFY